MSEMDARAVGDALRSERFLAASRLHATLGEIRTWDPQLVRELRLLVPVDLQALHVAAGTTEAMVRLPMLLSEEEPRDPDEAMPPLFDEGSPREPGVHLHWAMPDALLRGRLSELPDGSRNRLALPALPDRWVVLRMVLPVGSGSPHVRGWVLEADRAVAVPLESWSPGSPASREATPAGVPLDASELTGTVGGSAVWASAYDAVGNRFAFYDPLSDIAEVASRGVDGDACSYLVAGWWSDPASDPIDSARSADSLSELLAAMRWGLLDDWGDARFLEEYNASIDASRGPLGLQTGHRFLGSSAAEDVSPREAAATPTLASTESLLTRASDVVASSAFQTGAASHFITTPWHLRACLLHGAVYGVPVATTPPWDRRPAADSVRVAIGEHDGDVLAALADVPGAPENRRRDTERLLEAFTAQMVNRMGTPDGAVEIEEVEHSRAFASLPAGTAGTDRFLQRVEPGRAGGTVLPGSRTSSRATARDVDAPLRRERGAGRRDRAGAAASRVSAQVSFAFAKHDLVEATIDVLRDYQWQRDPVTLPPTEARVVERPAVRHSFPLDPVVAVQGAGRSLRHANDGRASADGTLTCRWPTQVLGQVQGAVSGTALLPSLGNGSVPPEVLSLAREVLLHDPYHTRWLAAAAAPTAGLGTEGGVRLLEQRLLAEAGLRFGSDATYDGTTRAFAGLLEPDGDEREARLGTVAGEIAATRVTDQLLGFSLATGADPNPVGVTCWSQPWVPLWVEWRAELTGPSGPTVDGWRLAAVDLQPAGEDQPSGTTRTLEGRAVLTTGAATTLQSAVEDWLAAEDARDAADPLSSQADPTTEAALADLAAAVVRTDVVTAALDGLRSQLLGLPYRDGVSRRAREDGLHDPVPVAPPVLLRSGALQLARVRLLDAFGRVLELPVDAVAVTARDSVPARTGALAMPPRLTRPARWQLRLVDSATLVGEEGVEARVDQVDPTLQVSPVAGFLLPDHLDESLEVFAADGAPLGELLHAPVGGGVVWEIAPGRDGPPDAGPRHGLGPQQQPLASFAMGLLAADAAHRGGRPAEDESALSALLRAIDTTLWTVDTFAGSGGEHVAGLVGRPVAVVRAQLRLELRTPERIDLSDPARRAEWDAAERALQAVAFPVRIGELTRTDDVVLGFFVDDEFSRFRPVDKAVAELARDAGRSRGQLGLLQPGEPLPPAVVIDHPYVVGDRSDGELGDLGDSDTLHLHLGQTVTLTLLMLPVGQAFLTSGILPRTSVALARDWVAPGLARIAPSLRTGPLLVETDIASEGQVRLPKVSVLGQDQDLWWRDTPASWRNDAILAATQTALLPDTPSAEADDPAGRAGFRTARRREIDLPAARTQGRRAGRTSALPPGTSDDGSRAPLGARAAPGSRTDLWVPLGPSNVVRGGTENEARVTGRVRSLHVSPDGQRVYAATANGGVWYSADGARSWRSLGGLAATDVPGIVRPAHRHACGAILVLHDAAAPDDESRDTVLVGTGELTPSSEPHAGRSLGGIGVLVATGPAASTTDDPWTEEAPNLRERGIYRLAAEPGGSTVVAATSVGLFERPTGGGQGVEWTKVPGDPFGDLEAVVTDVLWTAAVAGGPPARLWAWVQGSRHGGLWVGDTGGTGGAGGTGGTDFVPVPTPGTEPRRSSLAAASSPTTLYVFNDRGDTEVPALVRVSSGPAAPTAEAVHGVPHILGDQGFYNLAVAVDPADATRVVLGGAVSDHEINATGDPYSAAAIYAAEVGESGGRLTYGAGAPPRLVGVGCHVDVHDLRWSPTGDVLWAACDGGVFRSRFPEQASGFVACNDGLAVVEANYVACHPVCEGWVVVGLQDNGVIERLSSTVWDETGAGDGGGVAFDPLVPTRYVRQFFRGRWDASDGAPFILLLHHRAHPFDRPSAGTEERDAAAFYSTVATIAHHRGGSAAPTHTQVLLGTTRPWYTENWAASWATLPTGRDPVVAATFDREQDLFGEPITVCKWSTSDVAWVLGDHRLQRLVREPGSDDHGGPGRWSYDPVLNRAAKDKKDDTSADDPLRDAVVWTDVEPNLEAPAGTVGALRGPKGAVYLGAAGAVDDAAVDTLWWFDGDATWHRTHLRDAVSAPVTAVRCDPRRPDDVYVGTTVGVWRGLRVMPSADDGDPPTWSWQPLVNGLPEAVVEDLALFEHDGLRLLRAAVAARGVYELRLGGDAVDVTHVRAHDDDLRYRSRALEVQRDGTTPRSWHGSPDVRPRRAPYAPPAPTTALRRDAPGPREDLRRFQAALRSSTGDERIRPTGRWDLYFEDLLRHHGAPVDASDGRMTVDAAYWASVMVPPHGTAEPWAVAGDPSAPPAEVDLHDYAPVLREGAADTVSVELANAEHRVDVVVHHRGLDARDGSDVRVTLLRWTRPPEAPVPRRDDPSTWFQGDVPWATAVDEVLDSDGGTTSRPLGPGWRFAVDDSGVRRRTLAGQRLDGTRAGVVTFDLDLRPFRSGTVMLLVAVLRAGGASALATRPLRDLALEDPHVAVRSLVVVRP